MNVLLLTSHSIAEHDDLAMLASIPDVDVFSIGAYTNPAKPSDDARPPLDVPAHPELAVLCERQREKHAGEDASFVIDWAKGDLHPDLIDWADTIICHHFPIPWLVMQWPKFKGKRVIWRTCGQSDPSLEAVMLRLRPHGLEIIRYSPKEQEAFSKWGVFAGEDAMIRFGKDPAEWYGWHGSDAVVGNVTQNMVERGDACGYGFWRAATDGLPTRPAGAGSERIGGTGRLGYDAMREYLRSIRVYLYTGTRPASYTLGLIEAMMTGVPVVSIGPRAFGIPELFEAQEFASAVYERPEDARTLGLRGWLDGHDRARSFSESGRQRAIDLFGIEAVTAQWASYLGVRVAVAA